MRMYLIAFAVALVTICCAADGQQPAEADASTGTRHLVQAFAGFNQPNDLGIPCASPCFGVPAGTVVVQPNQFVSSNSTGLYYVVLQANGWTGDLSTTFTLSEAGVVVQAMTATGFISTEQAHSSVVLSGSATIPENSFVGPATLTATTTATPSNGGQPLSQRTYSTLQVGGAGTRRLVLAFVGMSSSNGGTGFPCAYPLCPLANFPGTVVVQPAQFQLPLIGTVYYAVFQASDWQGQVEGTCEVIEQGRVVYTVPVGGGIGGQGGHPVQLFGTGGLPLVGNYVGPALLRVTMTATQGTGNQFTLTSYAPVVVE